MRISTILLASFLAFPLALGACSNDSPPADNDPFDTLQDCYDEHHSGDETLPIQEAIVTCCLDHPIGGVKAPTCPGVQTDCVTYVHTALPSILDADINAACMTYITESHK